MPSPSSRRSGGGSSATPETIRLTPAEAFVLVRTAARQLRDAGLGVDLASLSGVWPADSASRSGGTAGTIERFHPGESLSWSWDLMIGGVTLTLRELERLSGGQSVRHKGPWIELRPNDLKNAERFCSANPELSLDDALRLTATEGELLMRLPVHQFEAGQGFEPFSSSTAAESPGSAAGSGRVHEAEPYQERGLG